MSSGLADSLLGPASTLASLNLVFLGFVASGFRQDSSTRPHSGPNRYLRLAALSLGAFVVGVIGDTVCVCALLTKDPSLTTASVVLFFAQLASLLVTAGYALYSLL